MWVRLRLPELLKEHGISAYRLAEDSDGAISHKTAYRLVKRSGNVRYLDTLMLQAIYKQLGLKTLDDLLSPEPLPEPPVAKKPSKAKSARKRRKQATARAA